MSTPKKEKLPEIRIKQAFALEMVAGGATYREAATEVGVYADTVEHWCAMAKVRLTREAMVKMGLTSSTDEGRVCSCGVKIEMNRKFCHACADARRTGQKSRVDQGRSSRGQS